MEISKGLQEEILVVQNKLKNAIRDHQICVGKLKDDPNNTDILGQIQEIHLHIVSLGRCQKQVVQRLRKEVETFKAQNVNGAKVSIASLLGLNNNNHITNNNEEKRERKIAPVVVVSTKPSKEDYEEIVRNGDVPSPTQDAEPPKDRPISVETISGEDDVIEVSMDENSNEKQENLERQRKTEDNEKVNFLSGLGLITTVRYAELQNKRAERKRRSTANPQFVYSSLEMPTKRKRHSYLQSTGCAPQTRQTTARLNGPSPPPSKVLPPKAISPPTRTVTKSLIPVQKSTTRPNILRNVTDSKVYVSKAKTESEACQVQLPTPSVKPIVTQSVNSKTVHIPGLPSSLTIERIESDSVVCINCRNPGTLTVCENCSSSYHVSCHSISPPPPRTCPKCALVNEEEEGRLRFRKDEELEEKERERYELRERNSELRLQVYELEKRSQLLGQSLQLQQRTRQELLGKQEKTQRSIKRLVDFIKLMQLRRDTQSPPRSASVSSHPRPSSSRSPQTASPPQTSGKPIQSPPAHSIVNSQRTVCPIPPSSSISCPGPASPMSTQSHPKCPTPTSYLPITPSQKSTNHTSLSRKSQSQSDGTVVSILEIKPSAPSFLQSSITNCQPRQVTMLAFSPTSLSPIQPCSSTSTSPVATVKNQNAPYPRSIASSTQKSCVFQPNVNWSNQPSTGGSPVESSSRGPKSVSTSCEQQELRKSSYQPTILQSPTNSCKSQSQQQARKKQRPSAIVLSTGQEPAVYSTHCSQAITSPISSPIILASREVQTRAQSTMTQTPTNSCIIKTNNWNQQAHNQTTLQSRYNAEPSQSSSGT